MTNSNLQIVNCLMVVKVTDYYCRKVVMHE